VLTEAFALTLNSSVTATTVPPWLWHNTGDATNPNDTGEFLWTLGSTNWGTVDGNDHNTLPGDAYGWNFSTNSPNIIAGATDPGAGHGAGVVGAALAALNAAGSDADRVRFMVVIGTGTQVTDYVTEKKEHDHVNIIAVSNSTTSGAQFSRANALALRGNGILLFVPGGTGVNADLSPGDPTSSSFLHATPRRGTQLEAVDTILPVTVDPDNSTASDYGINSFYFATPIANEPSYVQPVGAVYAAAAAQEYQDAHSGVIPTAMKIKRAMMSGVTYTTDERLEGRTITHDFDGTNRQNGGLLNLSAVISSINQTTEEITGVSITEGEHVEEDPLGTTVEFDFDSDGDPANWTISWGDNSLGGSGVEVLPGDEPSREHIFPFFENAVHHYYPTIYAMSDTGQVYLQDEQMPVVTISTPFAPTSLAYAYILERETNGEITLRLGAFSHRFGATGLPHLIITLGADDTLKVDFTNGNVLANTALRVIGDGAAGGVSVVGTGGADTLTRTSAQSDETLSIESSFSAQFRVDAGVRVTLDGAGGNDTLSGSELPCTLIGGSGTDLAIVGGTRLNDTITVGGSGISVASTEGNYSVAFTGVESINVNGGNPVGTSGDDLFIVPADLALPVSVDGGDGTDTLTFNGTTSGDDITIGTSSVTCGSTVVTSSNTEKRIINGGAGADTISASSSTSAVSINGEAGTDSLTGGSAADLLTGGNDADNISGGGGMDTIYGGAAADNIWGGDARDLIYGDAGNDVILAGDGNDVVYGGENADAIYGDAGDDNIHGDAGNDWIEGGAGTDTLYGDSGDDFFNADDGEEDELWGGGGWDSAIADGGFYVEDELNEIEELLA
jgi:hypothetical protein